jgi:hypothetical protein
MLERRTLQMLLGNSILTLLATPLFYEWEPVENRKSVSVTRTDLKTTGLEDCTILSRQVSKVGSALHRPGGL